MSGPAHRVQSAQVEYGFPQGHLGHLSEEEETAFGQFKLLCEEKGYYKPAEANNGKASHDDALMLRFLRARRFVVTDAYKQFEDTEEWRKASQLDQLYETIDLEHYEETRRLYPQWTGRRDRRGIPVYVYEVKHLNAKTMSAYEKSATKTTSKAKTDGTVPGKLIRLFALYENLTRFVMPLCTALTDRENPRTPITQSNNIVDISGVGLKQFWNLRGHMQDASTLATAHYPETLDRIFIIGAPAFFPTVWGWIKKWFDPITTSKIFILGSGDLKKTLESFIDPANIPKKYGGELDFTFGDFPKLDPAIQKVAQWSYENSDFPHGPLYWVQTEGPRWEEGRGGEKIKAVAVGSTHEKQRREDICTIERVLQAPATEIPYEGVEGGLRANRPELLTIPTATGSINQNSGTPIEEHLSRAASAQPQPTTIPESDSSPSTPPTDDISGVKLELNGQDQVAVQEGELVPAKRPDPVTFVTASEGIQTLNLNEKPGNMVAAAAAKNGTGPHQTVTANKLDPSLDIVNGNGVEQVRK